MQDILIIQEYKVNHNDNIKIQIKYFILRYRRILGLILLIILLDYQINSSYRQSGGGLKKLPSANSAKGLSKYKSMKNAGFTKLESAGATAYDAGATAGNKTKEFAGWLYQILFGIAIALAILLIVLPSLSFFIIGIICYFLLKNKISALKSA